ncbi:MAG: MBOAT family protein [Candidatus Omnitrophica bacterium]|nr:MBOAT family protein [Candidatus Omnitrophota bacterium]
MLFNSFQFLFFFCLVYFLYRKFSHKHQNILLLVSSYVFYGAWNWKFLSLIIISTLVDFYCGAHIHRSNKGQIRKKFLIISIIANLGILAVFKYYNFFVDSFSDLLSVFGLDYFTRSLNIILPVGISFYTFQTMSYTIDIYRKEIEPVKKLLDFGLFVAFFPQLVAGPIERAKHLLPQVTANRTISPAQVDQGLLLIFWGLFQKVFVADNLAKIVEPVFASNGHFDGITVLLALYAFAFQIYCDFAGYSNIARGLASLMGFDLMVNFNFPYTAKGPREFWKKWHISLSTWLRDYVYIPLGGNKNGSFMTYRNLFLTMFLGGLWHGAAWGFVVWGIYQGALLIGERFLNNFTKRGNALLWIVLKWIVFFHIVCIGWLLFRAKSLHQAYEMFLSILHVRNITNIIPSILTIRSLIVFLFPLIIFEYIQYKRKDLYWTFKNKWFTQAFVYAFLIFLFITFGSGGGNEFIYFQF